MYDDGNGTLSILMGEEEETDRAERVTGTLEDIGEVTTAAGRGLQDIINSILGVKSAAEGGGMVPAPAPAPGRPAGTSTPAFDPKVLIVPGITIAGLMLIAGMKKARR